MGDLMHVICGTNTTVLIWLCKDVVKFFDFLSAGQKDDQMRQKNGFTELEFYAQMDWTSVAAYSMFFRPGHPSPGSSLSIDMDASDNFAHKNTSLHAASNQAGQRLLTSDLAFLTSLQLVQECASVPSVDQGGQQMMERSLHICKDMLPFDITC